MRQITITNGTDTVTLLKDIVFKIHPEIIAQRAKMASGKTVEDTAGEKVHLEIPTGWLSSADLAKLRVMIRRDRLLTVSYPDVDGEKTEQFLVDSPEYKTFKYGENGVDIWYGVTLTMEAYGVVTGA